MALLENDSVALPPALVPDLGGREPPQEKYLILFSHAHMVNNSNAEIYLGHIFTTQLKGIHTGKEDHLLESMRDLLSHCSPGCVYPEFFTSPNALQALVSKRLRLVRPIHTESLAKENFPNHRFLPFKSVFQIATKATFLKYTLLYSMHIDLVAGKSQTYGWQMTRAQDRRHLPGFRWRYWNKPRDSVSHMQVTLTKVNQNEVGVIMGRKWLGWGDQYRWQVTLGPEL